tara:strand:+ start:60143 stop:61033 length:891 start_codon:yes stop_codon:yes gene_type:complete
LLTYNQEAFIAQTIESIMGQITDFDYQLVIGEDHSPDSTRTICERYAKQYPDNIKLLPNLGSNVGLIANYMRTIKECDGKYIAICDGDDYWTDTQKLQNQVDFLETNPSCSIVYSNYTKLFPDGRFEKNAMYHKAPISTFEDLINNNFIPSVTALFVNRQAEEALPTWIAKYPYGDWPTYLWTIRDKGTVGYIDEDMSMYRMDIGTSAALIKENSALVSVNLGILSDMYNDIAFAQKKGLIRNIIVHRKRELMISYNRERKFVKGFNQLCYHLLNNGQKLQTVKLYLYSLKKNFKK